MESDKKVQFEAILERYNFPKEANWKPLQDWVRLAENNAPANKEGLMFMDAEELIRLIKLLDSSAYVEVKGSAGSVPLQDNNLRKYLILSLHKLLQLKWGFDKPNEEELKAGKIGLFAAGCKTMVEVGIKAVLEGEDGGFIQPYSAEELDALLDAELGLRKYKSIREGRGKNVAFLGDKVAEVLASIPKGVKAGKSKTDLLNFVGEVMALAGFLDDVPKWKELSESLAKCEKIGLKVGEVRKERKKMLENWLNGAKNVFYKAEICDDCRKCKDYGSCCLFEHLKFYDL